MICEIQSVILHNYEKVIIARYNHTVEYKATHVGYSCNIYICENTFVRNHVAVMKNIQIDL